jgi:hypothetical protein
MNISHRMRGLAMSISHGPKQVAIIRENRSRRWRRSAGWAAALTAALAATFSLFAAQPASAWVSPIPAGSTEIINRQDANCLTIDNSLAQRSYAYIAGCTTRNGGAMSAGQVWVITPQVRGTLGTFTIRPWANQRMCLDVQSNSPDNGAPLWLWPCNGTTYPDGGPAQEFTLGYPSGEDWTTTVWRLIHTHAGKCVDKAYGTVLQWECWSPWWQQWPTNTVQV